MEPHELLQLLDLQARPSETPTQTSIVDSSSVTQPAREAELSPTALHSDRWSFARGLELLEESERLKRSCPDEFAATDFFLAGFDPDPQLYPSCVDPRRHQFLTQLLNTPEYHALHTTTRLDDTAAGIAATYFAEQFAQLKQETHSSSSSGASTDAPDEEMAVLRAVGKAVAEASKEVAELHDTTSALGMGPGSPGSHDPRAVAALFKRVRNDPALRTICELAGRFRRVAQSRQRQKLTHGLDDIVGVTLGGEIARLLPSELSRLLVPELELDTLRRILERQALCREFQSHEPVGKGPILISLDESGSMTGEKIHTAKALALTMAWIARSQGRWCALIAYSGESGERLLPLPPGRWDESKLLDWLGQFLAKGSDLDVPVRELPRMYAELKAPPGITDVLLITDAQCRIPTALQQSFCAWKASVTARVIGVVLESLPGDLAHICDEIHSVKALTAQSDTVSRILSL